MLQREKVVNRVEDKLRESNSEMHERETNRLIERKASKEKRADEVSAEIRQLQDRVHILRKMEQLKSADDCILTGE